MADRSILDIIIRQKKQGKGVKDSEKEVGKLSKGLDKLSIAGVAAGAALAGAFIKISVDAIKLAGDVEEMDSKFEAVFKETAPEARAELEKFGDEVNRSKFELLEMASTVQDTFVPLGFARDKAKDLSIELTKLAVDVASFNNAQEPEVMAAFQSAIVGNHEAVRSYGIVITQASLDQELLRMGFVGGVQGATAQEKALARLNLIVAATGDAHGDAAKTADSFVNSLKGIDATITDLKVAWGNALMPTIKRALPVIAEASDAIIVSIEGWNALGEAQELGLITQENIKDLMGESATQTEMFAIAVELLNQHAIDNAAFLEEANTQVDGWAIGMLDAAGASGELAEGLGDIDEAGEGLPTLEDNFADIRTEIDLATAANNTLWDSMNTGIRSSIDTMQEQIAFFQAGGAGVQSAFENVQEALRAGLIAPEEAEQALKDIELAAIAIQVETGNIDMEDAISQVRDEWNVSLERAGELILNAGQFIDSIPAVTEKKIEFFIEYTGSPLPGPGGQAGLNMIVPSGFPNDTFPIRASSGEHVAITPADQISNQTDNFNLIINSQAQQEDLESNFDLMIAAAGGAS